MLWHRTLLLKVVGVHSPQSRAGHWRAGAAGTGMGPWNKLPVPHVLDWACKELKKIYICVVSSAKGLNLLVFHPLHSLGITQHTVKDNICAEPCVCV